MKLFKAVLRDERVEHYETQRVRKDGTKVDVSLTVSPIRDVDGTLVGASVIGRDISESKRAARRASFLAEAQSVLSSTLDRELTLRNVARLAVPHLADWCAIDVVGPDGSLERLALAHVDPAKERLAEEIERRYPSRHDPEVGALKAVISRRSELMREIPSELLDNAGQDEEHTVLIRRLGLRSAMIVPLVVHDRALGAITFVSAESEVLFDEDDLALAEDLATRAAVVTGLARYTLRTASLTDGVPSRVLGTLNEAMMLQPEVDRFCTVAYASLQPARGGAIRMTLGIGGHPLPLLLRRDGAVDTAGSPADDMAVLVLRVRDGHDVNGAGEAVQLEPARRAPA